MSIYERLRNEKEIVAFCGKKRSGKDTAGDAAASLGYMPIAFADPIKEICQVVFEFTDEQVYGSKKGEIDEFWDFSPRWAMQTIGTEMFRDHIGDDVWVKSLLTRIDHSNHDKFAVTDVRFPNEVDHLQRAGAEIVYIRRPKVEVDLNLTKKWVAKQGGIVKRAAKLFIDFGPGYHASEISLDDHPVTDGADIVNNASIDQFRQAAREYVIEVEKGNSELVEGGQIQAEHIV